MNSEELEMSLRTEFESHLKDVFADMRQDFSQFQEKFQAEFDKHKSQLDQVFQEFSGRLATGKELDRGFRETVVEHLRLARDEGARLTATAIAEAEEMARQSGETDAAAQPMNLAQTTQTAQTPVAGMSELRDAIKDITTQDSQGAILKSLVQHAAQFTPRGAFFIIKNDHFVGWRVFNTEGEADEDAVRDVRLPVSSETLLGESVRSMSAVEGTFGNHAGDAEYLNQIGFGEPEKMFAVPLVARGRGVAVLYADYGTQGESANIEALETLVRVAGLTVEMLASAAQPAKYVAQETPAVSQPVAEKAPAEAAQVEESPTEYAAPVEESQPTVEETESSAEESTAEFAEPEAVESPMEATEESTEETAAQEEEADDYPPIAAPTESLDGKTEKVEEMPTYDYPVEMIEDDAQEISVEPEAKADAPTETETAPAAELTDDSAEQPTTGFQFEESREAKEAAEMNAKLSGATDNSGAAQMSESFNVADLNGDSAPAVSETPAPTAARSRFGDRNVDLPIEVSEDERRLHNDARRFARLLVSEIKLYNEQKVKEGRESQDLYDRLREAIDRSRDMYDKRVQPPVAEKFDYFHYELVSTLAEGEPRKLGGDYPGALA